MCSEVSRVGSGRVGSGRVGSGLEFFFILAGRDGLPSLDLTRGKKNVFFVL